MDSFDDTRRFDPQNPTDSVGSSASAEDELASKPKAHLSLSQMKLDFSKKRITPLQRRVSDRTNRFLKSYVNPPPLESSKVSETEEVKGDHSGNTPPPSPPSSSGVDLAKFFQEKLLSSEDTPSVPDEVEENLLDYKPKKPSRKVSAGEVFRQELRAIKQRGALERMKKELKEEAAEVPEDSLGREDVLGEFDIPPFESSEETEAIEPEPELQATEIAAESLELEPVEQAEIEAQEVESGHQLFTDEEKAHLAKIREMAPEKSDPSFPFPSYLDEDLNPTEPRLPDPEPESEPDPEPEPEDISQVEDSQKAAEPEANLQELPPFESKISEHNSIATAEEPPAGIVEPASPPSQADGQVLFERKPRVTDEGPGAREIFSRDPQAERAPEQAQTLWSRPESRQPEPEPLPPDSEQEPIPEDLEQQSVAESEEQEPQEEVEADQSLEQESEPPTPPEPAAEAIERKPRVFRRSRTNPEAALSSPAPPREPITDMVTQSLSGKSFERPEHAQEEPPDTEGESPE